MSLDNNNDLSVQGILRHLAHELPQVLSGNFSERIFVYNTLESTNITAKDMVVSGDGEHGTVIISDFQSAGKGRYGKSFYSPAGRGLYISFILDSSRIGFSTPTLITAFAAVSVCEAIETVSNKSPQIKWVNDVFLDGKKVCGILTESVTTPDNTCSNSINAPLVTLGIGINFNAPAEEFPEDLQHTAGSLFGAETPSTTRNHLAAELIYRIFYSEYHQNEKKMLSVYKEKMFMLGKTIIVEGTDGSYDAIAVDIDNIGRLVVKNADEELLTLSSGEVSVRGFCRCHRFRLNRDLVDED